MPDNKKINDDPTPKGDPIPNLSYIANEDNYSKGKVCIGIDELEHVYNENADMWGLQFTIEHPVDRETSSETEPPHKLRAYWMYGKKHGKIIRPGVDGVFDSSGDTIIAADYLDTIRDLFRVLNFEQTEVEEGMDARVGGSAKKIERWTLSREGGDPSVDEKVMYRLLQISYNCMGLVHASARDLTTILKNGPPDEAAGAESSSGGGSRAEAGGGE